MYFYVKYPLLRGTLCSSHKLFTSPHSCPDVFIMSELNKYNFKGPSIKF